MRGLGANAGINFVIKDLNGLGHEALMQAMDKVITTSRDHPALTKLRTTGFADPSDRKTVG